MFTARNKKYRFILYNGPAIGFALLIFVMSSFPGYKLPTLGFQFSDKFVHTLEFGLFGIFLYRAFRYSTFFTRPYLFTILAGLPYAALDEFHQLYVPGRFSSVGDFAADSVGILLFAGISALVNPKKKENSAANAEKPEY
ncbi:VanZ family protein [Candidatus Latescibacterota bacterium]